MARAPYEQSVFINCPFDEDYNPVFDAVVFAVHDCGFQARCAREVDDSAENRFGQIGRIILESQYGIHDISRTEIGASNKLPRFNMPLELGLFLGAKRYGTGLQRKKRCLVLDTERYRYQQFISDIAGQDIKAHGGDVSAAIKAVRNWLVTSSGRQGLPGGTAIHKRFQEFQRQLPAFYDSLHLKSNEVTFVDYVYAVGEWLSLNAL